MAENVDPSKSLVVDDSEAVAALPPTMSLSDGVSDIAPPESVPVPTEDVVRCAKPKCATCFGKGKLVYHPPGEAGEPLKGQTKVCACAIRQFMRLHRRELFIDKSMRFFYLPKPEGEVVDETTRTDQAVVPPAPTLSEYHATRIRDMFARIARYETELDELDERYDRLADPILVELEVVKIARLVEATKLQEVVDDHARQADAVGAVAKQIEDLAVQLQAAKQRKLGLEAEVAAALKKIEAAETDALPGLRKQAGVEQRIDEVARKRSRAKRPMEQKIASLRKRITHLAAVNAISPEALAELEKLSAAMEEALDEAANTAVGDDVDTGAEEVSDTVAEDAAETVAEDASETAPEAAPGDEAAG